MSQTLTLPDQQEAFHQLIDQLLFEAESLKNVEQRRYAMHAHGDSYICFEFTIRRTPAQPHQPGKIQSAYLRARLSGQEYDSAKASMDSIDC